MKIINRKRVFSLLFICIFCVGVLHLFMTRELYKLPYIKILEEDCNSAIIYVWGHQYFIESDYFDNCGHSNIEMNIVEDKCAESVFDRIQDLRKQWKWDLYIFSGVKPKFERYRYDNLLIFFSGHGRYNNGQEFMISKSQNLLVKELGKTIDCNNITVIVDSCYSINWQSDFRHTNLTSMFTSDLCNETTPSKPYPSCTTNVQYYASFNYIFITNLHNGLNYAEANHTTFQTFYAMFPLYNCSCDCID